MKLRTWLAAAAGGLLVGYVAYPCFTLYRLQTALACGDEATLKSLVDWRSVRQGIEADIQQERRNTLPMFGAGFMQQIAVKSAVSPSSVVSALRRRGDAPAAAKGDDGIRSAWLEGPGSLIVKADGLRMKMQLGLDGWQVTRVWLPQPVLQAALRAG
jgi:hypothetical protein